MQEDKNPGGHFLQDKTEGDASISTSEQTEWIPIKVPTNKNSRYAMMEFQLPDSDRASRASCSFARKMLPRFRFGLGGFMFN